MSIREIKTRIHSVKNIQQITRAMKMVASARLRKAQAQLLSSRPYAEKMREMVAHISSQTSCPDHPLCRPLGGKGEILVVFSSDKGLCGGFNAQPLQTALRRLLQGQGRSQVVAIGRKAGEFFRRAGIKPLKSWSGFWQDLNWNHAQQMAEAIRELYLEHRPAQVVLIYNRFKSAIAQELTQRPLLPLRQNEPGGHKQARLSEFMFEPAPVAVVGHLLPLAVNITVWQALLESKAAELAARMQSMGNATDSAGEMIEELTLHMNRARQSLITREISELVGSAEAINH
jgi:F-type H+-transporting ATPase subunit gamma